MDNKQRGIPDFPPPEPGIVPSTLSFFVVGIGTSAGGIEALLRFFEAMPSDNGMAFVVVLHLSPKHESNIAEILQAKTKMPVLQVNETVAIEKNHVYVIPPTKDLLMNDGALQVVTAARPRGRHVAIDMFFRTLAEVHRERAVGIILSGAGADGTVGIARIKEKGGMTFAQGPDDAEYDSMPRSAVDTGLVDFILPAAEIPQKLIELFRNASSLHLPAGGDIEQSIQFDGAEAQTQAEEAALLEILDILQAETGHDFKFYKRATVLRRLERRLQVTGQPNVLAYRKYLMQHAEEARDLLQDMLISVTNFFRDRTAFETLEREIIPKIFSEAKENEQIRAWSVGCATGEEAYSIAMLLADQNNLTGNSRPTQVFASDIDERAVGLARRALYPESIVTDVTPARLRQYFIREEQHYCVKKEIRDTVLFAIHNILRDPPFSRLHLVSCRNLMIYLNRDVQKKVFQILHYALRPNGYLFLGSAESADVVPDYFIPVDKKQRIYQAVNTRDNMLHAAPVMTSSGRLPTLKEYPNRSERRKTVPQELHRQLLEEYAPPSILVDHNHTVLYATKQAGRYLHHPGGEPSHDILATVHPALQLELRAALFQASQSQEVMQTRYVPVRFGNENTFVRIVVRPGQDALAGAGLFLLVLEEKKELDSTAPVLSDATDNAVARQLEQELTQTKEQLRSVIEQYEIAIEDLKASNEELQASNEEMRSTTEELETSKEELQSINEELVTVNLELKIKVEEMAKINDDLQNFLAATKISTLFIDRNLRIQRYSKPCTQLFNIIATDISRSLLDITYRLDYPELFTDIEQVFDQLQPLEREVRGTDNGQWYIARLLPYRTADNRIEGLIISFIDISRRKAAEEKLRVSEQRMRLIAASTRDYAITTMDMNGLVTSWNGGAERLFGYTEQEMIGRSAEVLYTPEERAQGVFQEELRRAREDGRAEDERWHVRKNGSRLFCSGIAAPLIDQEMCGYVKIARDLTNSKWLRDQQEAKLDWEKQERIRAQEAARIRDEFFAVLSHELKQPLNLIQLTAEMLGRMPEAGAIPALSRSASTIKRMVEGQARIIDDLMDLSRLHTGKLTLSFTQINLNERVSHVATLMTKEAQQKKIDVMIEMPPEDLIVQGDSVRIEQIVWNLLSNALKFTPSGGKVQIKLSHENDMACMTVTDTGKGIAPEFLPFVFDMFRQANGGTTRQYGGMGIGLALVKELVNSHGGQIEARSDGEGQGAELRVTLPMAVAYQAPSRDEVQLKESLTGKRILMVDDAAEVVDALMELLTMEGAEVTPATSGEQALALVKQSTAPFYLIISDIGMPGMDGYTLLAELRKLKNTATTPALALSGFTRPNDVNHALEAGFETHICKPVLFDQFIATAARISS